MILVGFHSVFTRFQWFSIVFFQIWGLEAELGPSGPAKDDITALVVHILQDMESCSLSWLISHPFQS